VFADAVEHKGLDLGGRYACDTARFGLSPLQDRVRNIISVTHTELVGVRRAHAVAAVIEDATSQNGWRTFEPDLPRDGIGDELGLHGLEKLQVEDRLVHATMGGAPIDHFADVEPVLEQMGEGTHTKPDPAPYTAIGKTIGLGPDATPVELLDQGPHRAKL